MALVVKIKCQNTLRRLTIEEGKDGSLGLTFTDLVAKICNMFQISPEKRLVITYMDQDNDVVTMGDDQDLHDACVVQRINPLRIHVKVGSLETHRSINRFNCLTTEDAELYESSSLLANHTVEEIIKLVSNWQTKGASPHKLQHDAFYGSCVQANAFQRQAETVDACMVDNISRRMSRMFHKGVQCDVCGMTPIVGPRFKSTRKENYDLCCSCFTETGNEMEFQRIDRPIFARKHHHRQSAAIEGKAKRHLTSSTLAYTPLNCKQDQGAYRPFCSNAMTSTGGDHSTGKLDARFVKDITIFDGTEMVAGTHFTKIWRLRNIGTLPWPHGTQLVYMGGDVLGSDKSSFVELPAGGLHCEEEINVSVDLVAPQSPGRYVSHWRLRAPTGQKFGQRIWVLIQVVPKSVLANAATEVTLPVKVKDCRSMVNSNRDGWGPSDAMLSSQGAPARDRQDIQGLTYQAGKLSVSPDIIDASCNEGCQYVGSLNVATGKDQER